MLRGVCRIGVLAFFVLAAFNAAANADTAYSPAKNYFRTWEPMTWRLTTDPGDAIEARVDVEGDYTQGYTVDRLQDTGCDDDFEDCTRSAWNSLPTNAGILMLQGHGNDELYDAAASTTSDDILDKSSPYSASWTDPDGDGVPDSGMGWINHWGDWGCYVAYVTATWMEDNFASTLLTNKAIVIMISCHSSDGDNSPLDKCHGRTGFGYTSNVNTAEAEDDMELLFGRMNGTTGSGAYRKAGDAYDQGGWSSDTGFDQRGEDDTTLCPAPVSWNPEGSQGGGCGGWGQIVFDTVCDTSLSAASALTHTVDSGDVDVGSAAWSDNHTLIFYYTAEGSGWKVTMTAHADYVKAGGGGNQELDGSKVAPNGDDKVWSFED